MNQNFIKVSKDDVQTKKGFFWAINPDRMDALDQEIEKTLKAIGRRLNENTQLSLGEYINVFTKNIMHWGL